MNDRLQLGSNNTPRSFEMGEFGRIDLDILRGWKQVCDPELRRSHALPALARLVHLDSGRVEFLHSPNLLIGRYYPQNGPVDVLLDGLQEHELYRLGAPHLQMTMHEDGQWSAGHLAPGTRTNVGPTRLQHYNQKHPIRDADILTLGSARYRFEREDIALVDWQKACRALLNSVQTPSLFLCRNGAPCGLSIDLGQDSLTVIGRTLPPSDSRTVRTPWDESKHRPVQPSVDLAGLYPNESKYISFLHAAIRREDPIPDDLSTPNTVTPNFRLAPLAARQKTFLNRQEITESTPLRHGDEVALGPIFFYLHCPNREAPTPRESLSPPTLIDWGEDGAPTLDDRDSREDSR